MKRIFKFIPAALAVVALSSCSNDDLFGSAEGNLSQKNTLKVTVQQINDGDITRAANFGDGNGMVWQDGDQITVYDDQLFIYDPYKYNATAKAFVLAEDEIELIDKVAYALFPTAYFEEDESTNWERATDRVWVKANIPAQMKYGAPSDDANPTTAGDPYVTANGKAAYVSLLPMWGTASKNGETTEATMQYMTAIIKVTLTNAQDNVNYLYVRGFKDIAGTKPAQLSGNFKAYLSETGRTPLASTTLAGIDNATTSNNYIEVDISNINKATSIIYVPVPVGHYGKLDVWATKEKITTTVGDQTATAINAADKIYQFIDKDFEVKFYGSMTKKEYNVEVGSVAAINKLLQANKDEAKDNLVLNGSNGSETAATATDKTIALPQMAAGTVELKLKGITGNAVTISGDDFSKKFILNLTSTAQDITINLPNADVVLAGNYNSKNVTIENAKSLTFGDGAAPAAGTDPTTNGFGTIKINAEVQNNIVVDQFAKVSALTLPDNHRATGITVNEKGEAGDITVKASELAKATGINVAGKAGDITATSIDNAATNVTVSGEATAITVNGAKNTGAVEVSGKATVITVNGTGAVTLTGSATSITNTTGDVEISGAPAYNATEAAKVGTVETSGNVTVALTGEGAAVSGNITFNKTANLNLTQGYVMGVVVGANNTTVSVNFSTDAAGSYALLHTLPNPDATNKKYVVLTNASIWNGKKVGDGIPTPGTGDTYVKETVKTTYEGYVHANRIYTATAFAQLQGTAVTTWKSICTDLNMKEKEFTAMTSLSKEFQGSVQFKSAKTKPIISGLKLKAFTADNAGLFKAAAAGAVIQDIDFNGIEITTDNNARSNIGALVGLVTNNTDEDIAFKNLALTNVSITGKKLSANIGGVIGQVGSCSGSGKVTLEKVSATSSITGYSCLGGLIGFVAAEAKVEFKKGGTTDAPTFCSATPTFTINKSTYRIDANYAKVSLFVGSTETTTAANLTINVPTIPTSKGFTVTNSSEIDPLTKYFVETSAGVGNDRDIKFGQYLIGFTKDATTIKAQLKDNLSTGSKSGEYVSKGKVGEAPAASDKYLDYIKNF